MNNYNFYCPIVLKEFTPLEWVHDWVEVYCTGFSSNPFHYHHDKIARRDAALIFIEGNLLRIKEIPMNNNDKRIKLIKAKCEQREDWVLTQIDNWHYIDENAEYGNLPKVNRIRAKGIELWFDPNGFDIIEALLAVTNSDVPVIQKMGDALAIITTPQELPDGEYKLIKIEKGGEKDEGEIEEDN